MWFAESGSDIRNPFDAVVELIPAAGELPWLLFQYPQEPSLLQTHGAVAIPPTVLVLELDHPEGNPDEKSSDQITVCEEFCCELL